MERVALLAVKCLLHAYAHLQLWRLSAWTFTCIAEILETAEDLNDFFRSAPDEQDLQALLDRASVVFPTWFEWEVIPCELLQLLITSTGRRPGFHSTPGPAIC